MKVKNQTGESLNNMSYIQSTIKCKKCGKEMNVATGTFGGGIPKDCSSCKEELDYEIISEG